MKRILLTLIILLTVVLSSFGQYTIRFQDGTTMTSAPPGFNANEYSTIDAAVLVAQAASGALVIADSTFNISGASLTIKSTAEVIFYKGGMINAASAKNLTINGHVNAGAYQIFGSNVTVTFGDTVKFPILPEWWGAIPDNITDCEAAIELAVQAVPDSGILMFNAGTYYVSGMNYTRAERIVIKGSGKTVTTIRGNGTDQLTYQHGFELHDIRYKNFDHVAVFTPGYGRIKNITLNNCAFDSLGYVVYWNANQDSIVDNISVTSCAFNYTDGVIFRGTVNHFNSSNCTFENQKYIGLEVGRNTESATDIVISACTFNKSRRASGDHHFVLLQGKRIAITGCVFRDIKNTSSGTDCEGVYTKAKYQTITGNIFEDCGNGEGYLTLKINAADDTTRDNCVIANNVFRCRSVLPTGALLVFKSYGDATVSGNTFDADTSTITAITMSAGVALDSTRKLDIFANTINVTNYAVDGGTGSINIIGNDIRAKNLTNITASTMIVKSNKLLLTNSGLEVSGRDTAGTFSAFGNTLIVDSSATSGSHTIKLSKFANASIYANEFLVYGVLDYAIIIEDSIHTVVKGNLFKAFSDATFSSVIRTPTIALQQPIEVTGNTFRGGIASAIDIDVNVQYLDFSRNWLHSEVGSAIDLAVAANLDTLVAWDNKCYTTFFIDKDLSDIVTAGGDVDVKNNIGLVAENAGVSGAIATTGTIAHGLAEIPTYAIVIPSTATPDSLYVSALDATNITVVYTGGGTNVFYYITGYKP